MLQCDHCPKAFHTNGELDQHRTAVHNLPVQQVADPGAGHRNAMRRWTKTNAWACVIVVALGFLGQGHPPIGALVFLIVPLWAVGAILIMLHDVLGPKTPDPRS